MAYNEELVLRLEQLLADRKVDFAEKKMFGGMCLMVDEKMCICTKTKDATDHLLVRIGDLDYAAALENPNCEPMGHGKSVMKNFLYVYPPAYDSEKQLNDWVDKALAYNPLATRSKK